MLKNEIVNNANRIKEMLEMQKTLNNAIMKEKGLKFGDDKFNINTLRRAIIDEVGELNHELKYTWCWWKNTQAPVERVKVLEELVDVWHFMLSKHYLFDTGEEDIIILLLDGMSTSRADETLERDPIIEFINSYLELDDVITLTFDLGFDIDDVYECYILKNKVNFERLKNGY